MSGFCTVCETVECEGPVCGLCASILKKERARLAREAKKPTYNEYVRRVPLRPVTVPPVRFGQKEDDA
jgi:hypothetical protein